MSSRFFSLQGSSIIEVCSLLPESKGTIFRTMEPVISDQPHNLNDVIYFVARFLHPEVPGADDFFTDPYLWQMLIESNINVSALRRTSSSWLSRTIAWYEFFVDVVTCSM